MANDITGGKPKWSPYNMMGGKAPTFKPPKPVMPVKAGFGRMPTSEQRQQSLENYSRLGAIKAADDAFVKQAQQDIAAMPKSPYKKGGKISTAEKNPKHKNCW